jgi:hypothetical protein
VTTKNTDAAEAQAEEHHTDGGIIEIPAEEEDRDYNRNDEEGIAGNWLAIETKDKIVLEDGRAYEVTKKHFCPRASEFRYKIGSATYRIVALRVMRARRRKPPTNILRPKTK